ncbi:MAG: ribosomal protein S19 family protein [archaeon]
MAEEEMLVKSKDKFYRGQNVEELRKMDTREFAKLVKSRPRRAILRNYNLIENFINQCKKRILKNRPIRTHNRDLVIVPAFIGMTIYVHNGKEFVKVVITEQMLGHRLGEFSLTRKIAKHTSVGIGATKSSKSKSVK